MWKNNNRHKQQKDFVEKLKILKIDLIVIGPEIPLANGLAFSS